MSMLRVAVAAILCSVSSTWAEEPKYTEDLRRAAKAVENTAKRAAKATERGVKRAGEWAERTADKAEKGLKKLAQ